MSSRCSRFGFIVFVLLFWQGKISASRVNKEIRCYAPAKMGFAYNALPLDRLRQLVGPAHALDLVYTARTIDAAEAVRIGLVNDVADDLDGFINQRLSAILEHAPLSHRAHKRVLNEAPEPGSQAECAITDHLYDSQDYQEAVAAFTERRRPTFKGQ